MSNFLFKNRDGNTPLPPELRKGLRIKTIQTVGELDAYEEDNIVRGLSWLARKSDVDPIAYQFWLELHKRLFGRVWSWAGKIRTHELNNPDFLDPHLIWQELYALEENMSFWCKNSVYPEQEMMVRFHERLLTIHPFANGNGRFSRIITEQVSRYLKHPVPTWGEVFSETAEVRRRKYIDGIVAGRRDADYAPLMDLMYS